MTQFAAFAEEAATSQIAMKEIKSALTSAAQTASLDRVHLARKRLEDFNPSTRKERIFRFEGSAQLATMITAKLEADRQLKVRKPSMNLAPPAGAATMGGAGMSPQGIKDPELRKQYETAIAENRQRAEFWREHRWLEKELKSTLWLLTAEASLLYEQGKDGSAKLERDLAAQGMPRDLTTQVLETRQEK